MSEALFALGVVSDAGEGEGVCCAERGTGDVRWLDGAGEGVGEGAGDGGGGRVG